MTMLSWIPLRRWWQASFQPSEPVADSAPRVFRRPAARRSVRAGFEPVRQPLTPFSAGTVQPGSVAGARQAARRFWMTLDPNDQRRAAIGGSFAQVCAALERLAALEARQQT